MHPPPMPLVRYFPSPRFGVANTSTAGALVEDRWVLEGYRGAVNSTADEQPLLQWLKTTELVRLQESRDVPGLLAVKKAIGACVDEIDDLLYRVRDDQLTVDLHDGRTLPLHMLPSGVRSMLDLVGDMAWRAAFLNPQFGGDAARETPGVVLIDEIDLHLHPRWQRRVVDDLKRAFPKVQFIVTTHSPFIIQSLGDMATTGDRLIVLDDEDTVPDHPYAKSSIEDIAEDLQGLTDPPPQRSRRYWEMVEAAEAYYRELDGADRPDESEKERLKQRLDALSERYGDDPAYLALLRAETKAAGLGVGDE